MAGNILIDFVFTYACVANFGVLIACLLTYTNTLRDLVILTLDSGHEGINKYKFRSI